MGPVIDSFQKVNRVTLFPKLGHTQINKEHRNRNLWVIVRLTVRGSVRFGIAGVSSFLSERAGFTTVMFMAKHNEMPTVMITVLYAVFVVAFLAAARAVQTILRENTEASVFN